LLDDYIIAHKGPHKLYLAVDAHDNVVLELVALGTSRAADQPQGDDASTTRQTGEDGPDDQVDVSWLHLFDSVKAEPEEEKSGAMSAPASVAALATTAPPLPAVIATDASVDGYGTPLSCCQAQCATLLLPYYTTTYNSANECTHLHIHTHM
jgi:hypothetical protein